MKDGYIAQIGTPEEILTNPADDYVSEFVAGVDRAKILTADNVMKRPEPVVSINSELTVAVQLMKRHGISSIFVVNPDKVLQGIVLIDHAVSAMKQKKKIVDIMIGDFPKLQLDTPVKDIIPIVAESQYPLPVVDDANKLRGIIVRGSVLGALAMTDQEAEEKIEEVAQ
jgi:glycine betaine/proline transport system ATP-binding protein